MKIVNVVGTFHPFAGYENNLLSKFMVRRGHQYTILTSSFDKGKKYYVDFLGTDEIEKKDLIFSDRTGVSVERIKTEGVVSGRVIWNYKSFINKVKQIMPNVLFFCGNDSFIFIKFIIRNRKRIVKGEYPFAIIADSHMLDMASKNKLRKIYYLFYRLFVTPIILKANIPIIRWQNDDFVEKRLGIPLDKAPFISFGTDTLLFRRDYNEKLLLRKKYQINIDDFLIVYAGKIDESKGGLFFADAIKKRICSTKNIVFLIVAKATSEYEKNVVSTFKESENRVIVVDTVPYFELPQFYQSADLVVFPKQCSLSFYDVQACGTPVLLEDNSINIERVSHNNGFVFSRGDSESLINMIVEISKKEDLDDVSNNAISFISTNYDYDKIAEKCEEIFKGLLHENNGK